ncbi:hypothetical protein [Actinoplanes sp. NBRC 103695]|uniref:hypothetical protein n=1 Tax=Actinoplanes sp. NBRC 103695 TaxID=3032202 RepID=UPI002557B320|nr:hypothetical protein [Actinoplanes sp. NBRC 103695]
MEGRLAVAFRSDLPIIWLVNAAHYILYGAASSTAPPRRSAPAHRHSNAPVVVTATVQSILAAPTPERPAAR